MTIIPLAHSRALRYPVCRHLFRPTSLMVRRPEETIVFTFRQTHQRPRILDAFSRLQTPLPGDVVLSEFDSTPLYILLLWDVAHTLLPGNRLYLQHSGDASRLLSSPWYQQAFRELKEGNATLQVFEKRAPLPTEAERGLDAWSFCIPAGPDSRLLNACVARILQLNVPQFEILLCGRPGPEFAYHEQVRITGEDIPSYPLHITRKKNTLATAARYPNLCILHDRVLLPMNFMTAIRRFGDDFPLTGFQSFWFADTWQSVPRRYSDFAVAARIPAMLTGKHRPQRACLPSFDTMEFQMQHPRRATPGADYLTGSLYLCKRSVWQYLPQNEALYWAEYEDVEHGIRAGRDGIPSRINPWTLTQSLRYRSVFHFAGRASGHSIAGQSLHYRAPQEYWGFPRRPSLPVTESEGRRRLIAFAQKYTGSDVLVRRLPRHLTGIRRYQLIRHLLQAAQGKEDELLQDWFHLVLCEAPVPPERAALQAAQRRPSGTRHWLRHPSLLRQLYNNPFSSPFLPDSPRSTRAVYRRKAGCLLSALYLKYINPHTAFPLSLRELWETLYLSAPKEEI
ncbi:hypothetical protein MXF09_23630 [Klebsiella aerogenes]|uniref:hypothetical protein n=1 Tax=Klebsiella aerogenes TaxID=548 RepID=UPI002DBCDED2|nr:hypothetical protein [Klebsiella aerogenes]MEB5742688.1 hypothetical protein [Klebsiella aerogenes]